MLFYLVLAAIAFLVYRSLTKPKEPRYLGQVASKKHAVVIGGGIGGLCAAKLLSSRFEKVTLIDRDEFDLTQPQHRAGVPQGQQLHGLLARGCAIVDKLFPGLIPECLADGATNVELMKDFRVQMYGVYLPKSERVKEGPTLYGVGMSRPFFEYHLRKRLSAVSNVEILPKTTVLGLIYDEKTGAVTGVRIKRRGNKSKDTSQAEASSSGSSDDGKSEVLADVVVCSAGRRNKVDKWLADINVVSEQNKLPQETSDSGLEYVTSRMRPPQGWVEKQSEWYHAIFALPNPGLFDVGFGLSPVENGEYSVVVFSYGKNRLPRTTEELLERLRPALKVNNQVIEKIMTEWEMVRDWVSFNVPKNVFRHYEKMSHWPDNFFAVGDTIATFNPSYGQGMTQASMHVELLGELLDTHLRDFPVHDLSGLSTKFQKAASVISTNFWSVVEVNDLQWPATEGERSKVKDLTAGFLRHVWLVVCTNRDLALQFFQVTNGLMPPDKLFSNPNLLGPVLVSIARELYAKYSESKKTK